MKFIKNDGGRKKYFRGNSGDCAVRALTIFFNEDYKKIYNSFNFLKIIGETPRNGNTPQKIFDVYTKKNLVYIELFRELNIEELYEFKIIIEYDNHVQACIYGVVHDTHQKYKPFEANSIWCHKNDEEKINMILNGNIKPIESKFGLTWVS